MSHTSNVWDILFSVCKKTPYFLERLTKNVWRLEMDGQKHFVLEKLKMEQVKYFLKLNVISYLEDLTTE